MTDRWKRLVPPLAGVAMVVCLTIGITISGNSPDAGASGTKVLDYYRSHHGRTIATFVLIGYAAVMAIVYYAGVAAYLRRRGSEILASLTLVGGVVFGVALTIGAGTNATLGDNETKLSASAAQALNQISADLFFVMLFAGVALATLSMGISMLRTKAMPKAVGILAVIVGVVAVSGIGAWFGFMASGLLTLVVAGYLYQRTGQVDEIVLPDVPAQREAAAEPRSRRAAKSA